jgi:predicted transcriptional regulator of viral defense system
MNQKELILEIAKQNNGIVLTKQVNKAGIGRWALKAVVEDKKLISVQRGVYAIEGSYVDDFFLLQQKYAKGIYSHETALYLHGFSNRAPIQIVMTFKQGTSTARMKEDNVRPVVVSKEFDLGIIEIERSGGTAVRVYDVERTLIDLVKPKYDADLEQLMPAFRRYAVSSSKDVNQLYRYAMVFGVEDKIRNYMGVLL